jgi:uncharacterized protein (TIGR02301 family)
MRKAPLAFLAAALLAASPAFGAAKIITVPPAAKAPAAAPATAAATAAVAPPAAPPVGGTPSAAPYEDQLLRLAEILGDIHYLLALCQIGEGDQWLDQMDALLNSEQPDEARRRRMVDRFNRGYESFRSVYRECTPAAATASNRYLQEGVKIAADITARYGK